MGRYDSRLQVYTSSGWKNVKRVQVNNGSNWIDFGDNDSSNTRKIEVYTDSSTKVRITRNKVIHTIPAVPSDGISSGRFKLLPVDVWCTYGIPVRGGNFIFNATVRKHEDTSIQLFRVWHPSNGDCLRITWLADGRLEIYTKNLANNSYTTSYTSNAVLKDHWANIQMTFTDENLGYNKKGTVKFKGTTTTIGIVRYSGDGTTNEIGSTGLEFKDTLTVHGSGRSSSVSSNKTVTLNMSDPDINNNLTDHTSVPNTPSEAIPERSYPSWE